MTENTTDPKLAKAEAAAAKAKARSLRPWFQKKRFIIPGALIALMVISSAANIGNTDAPVSVSAGSTSMDSDATGTSTENDTTSTEPSASLTLAQENAIESAQSYLDYSGFSRANLLDQLTSEYGEGFDKSDAEFAIKYLEQNSLVDWNQEAVDSAESYLEFSSYSRQGLLDQLTSKYGEQFTTEQANFALKAVGY